MAGVSVSACGCLGRQLKSFSLFPSSFLRLRSSDFADDLKDDMCVLYILCAFVMETVLLLREKATIDIFYSV